jgi:predicted ester cyclase
VTAATSGYSSAVRRRWASGDKVVVRFTNSGTHTGPFMGAEATGIHAEWPGIGVYTVRNSKIVSGWFGEDVLGMMLQLGVVKL